MPHRLMIALAAAAFTVTAAPARAELIYVPAGV
jgi:hypothetical protein